LIELLLKSITDQGNRYRFEIRGFVEGCLFKQLSSSTRDGAAMEKDCNRMALGIIVELCESVVCS